VVVFFFNNSFLPFCALPIKPPETDQWLTRNCDFFQHKQIKIGKKTCVLLADWFFSHIHKTHNFSWHYAHRDTSEGKTVMADSRTLATLVTDSY